MILWDTKSNTKIGVLKSDIDSLEVREAHKIRGRIFLNTQSYSKRDTGLFVACISFASHQYYIFITPSAFNTELIRIARIQTGAM